MKDENKYINTERDVYQDSNGNRHTRVNQHTETVRSTDRPEAYRDGYTHGRIAEQRHLEETQTVRDNDNAARGLLLGIILTSLVGLAAGLYYLSQRNTEEPVPATAPVVIPSASPEATLSPTPQNTIIQERTIESSPTIIPVPQPQATTSPAPQQNINIRQAPASPASPSTVSPDINITVPPSPAPSPTATSGGGTLTPPATDNTTAPQGSQSSTVTPSPNSRLQAPSGQTAPTTPGSQSNVSPQASPNASDTTLDSTPQGTSPNTTGTTPGSDSSTGNTGSSTP